MVDAFAELAAIATMREEEIDLARGALAIAASEYPGLDENAYLASIDELAREAGERIPETTNAAAKIEALNRFLFGERGFRGNEADYYDPRNSFLNDVLDRRLGIPITLSLLYCEVGRRIGLPLVGVGFPGHFLARHTGDPDIVIDPFAGKTLTIDDCRRLLETVAGRTTELDPAMLRAARPREILVRILRNLKLAWLRREDMARALAVVERILLFLPEDPVEIRDRGTLYLRLECFAPALRDLERYLELAPNGEGAAEIRERLPELHRKAASLQ